MDIRNALKFWRRPLWHALYMDEDEVRREIIDFADGDYDATRFILHSRACDELRGIMDDAAYLGGELAAALPEDGRFLTVEIALSAGPAAPREEVWRILSNRFTAVAVMKAYVMSKALPYWCAGGEPAQLERIVWRV